MKSFLFANYDTASKVRKWEMKEPRYQLDSCHTHTHNTPCTHIRTHKPVI